MSMINLKSVSRIYNRSDKTVTALNGINFCVEKGEYVSVLGTSGSGKSTLMNVLGTLDRPDFGEYTIDGVNVGKMSNRELDRLRRNKIGFIFQKYCLVPSLTAFDNVELPLIYAKVPRAERIKRVSESLEKVGLVDRANHKPNELSGGQQQRVAVARAIVTNPPIILADEPTGNLDPKTTEQIAEIFDKMHLVGKTIILITHDNSVAKRAERQVVINKGKIE